MKIGDLVKLKYAKSSPIGIVVHVRRPIKRGGQWYYLVKWSNDIHRGSYCSTGIIEVVYEGR